MPKRKITLEAVNQRLKAGNVGLTVYLRGDKLYLQGTLPPKLGSKKAKPHQQRIALKIYNNPAGLETAEARAKELGGKLARGQFSWLEVEGGKSDADSCRNWIERFKKHALQNIISAEGEEAELKWKSQFWHLAYSKLDPTADLTETAIINAVQKTPPNSRSRQVCCQKMKRLAKFAGIEVDLKDFRGGYSPSEVEREIPDDDAIAQAIDKAIAKAKAQKRKIDRERQLQWCWVAGMMATYGLRNHECWFATLHRKEQKGRSVWLCSVEDGKTGGRLDIPPLNPEWCDRWKLYEGSSPNITVRTNREYGERCATAFKRIKLGVAGYSFRHGWAIRATIQYGFPTAVVAKWLGHDPSVFLSIYQKHITGAQATDLFFNRI